MAISVNFNGATIFRPGSYSKTNIDLSGGFPIGPAGLVAVIGEADAGTPGASEVNIADNRFTGDQLSTIREKYRSGPIVDSASFLFAPAADAAIPSGAQTVWFYKTNASVRASLALANTYGTVRSLEWGIGGNRITYKNILTAEVGPSIQSGAIVLPTASTLIIQDLTYEALIPGTSTLTVEYVDGGIGGLAVTYVAPNLVVDFGGATPTAAQVKAAVDLVAGAAFKPVTVSGTGTDIQTAPVAQAPLAGGTDPLSGVTFSIMVKGVLSTVTLGTNATLHDTIGHLVTELTGLLPAGVGVSAGIGSTIILAASVDATAQRNGYGKSIELNGAGLTTLGLVAGLTVSGVESAATITIDNKRDLVTESDTIGGNVVVSIGYTGAAGTATVTINATSLILNEAGVPVHTFDKSSYTTLSSLIAEINLKTGWTASIGSTLYGQLSPSVLDRVTTVGAKSLNSLKPARIKKDAFEAQDMFALSSFVELVSPSYVGLPDAASETSLSGGLKGATTTLDIVNALDKFTKFHVNFILPLFSRDAIDDIADTLTDGGSTYTIDGIHQAVKTHISLMKTTKKRSERQSVLSLKDSFVNCKDTAMNLADGRLQLAIQDIRQIDAQGAIKWFQPWGLAALLTGARCGAPIGEPMTFKFLNTSGIRQTAQPMSTAEANIVLDFDPDTQYEEAIQVGLTFLENPQTGGFRIVVDNTTYGVDDNFVWNRGNVIYAGDSVAYNFRNAMEARYVGKKNIITKADVIGTADSVLRGFLDQGITVSTADAPSGYKQLTVQLIGNKILIGVVIKIVEGIDWVLSDITIQRATQ